MNGGLEFVVLPCHMCMSTCYFSQTNLAVMLQKTATC